VKNEQKLNMGAGIAVAIGVMVSFAVMLAGAAISAAMILSSRIPVSAEAYCTMAVLLLSSFSGVAVACRNIGKRRLIIGTLIAAVYYILLLGITAIWFEGRYQGVGVTGLVILCGGIVGTFLGTKDKKQSISRKSKIKHRQYVQNLNSR